MRMINSKIGLFLLLLLLLPADQLVHFNLLFFFNVFIMEWNLPKLWCALLTNH